MAALATMGWFGPFCALMSSVTWAVGSSGYSKLAKENSAFAVNFSRGLIAFPLFLLVAMLSSVWAHGSWQAAFSAFGVLDSHHVVWFALSILASYAVGDSLFLMSSQAIGIPAALTIGSSYPILTATWGAVFQGEWLSLAQWLGLLITVGGVALVILCAPREAGEKNGEGCGARRLFSKTTGILLAFGSMFLWAINNYAVTQGGQGVSAPVGNTVRMGIAILLCGAIGKLASPGSRISLPLRTYRKWLWLFVLEGFGGSYLFMYGLSHSPLAIGSTLTSVAPVISVPVALALGLERFSWKRTAGVITVVFGLFLLMGG